MDDKQKKTKEKSVSKLVKSLCDYAAENQISLNTQTSSSRLKARQKKVVCKTFHGAGLVVPVDDNDVGYRPVPETPGSSVFSVSTS